MPRRKPEKPVPTMTKAQAESFDRLKALEAAGAIVMKEKPRKTGEDRTFELVVAKPASQLSESLMKIGVELGKLQSEPMSELLFTAIGLAKLTAQVSAFIAGAVEGGQLDPAAAYAERIALARLALNGYQPDDRGKRADIHDFLLWNATEGGFAQLSKKEQRERAEVLGRGLAVRSGKGKVPGTQLVLDALRCIATPAGRPRGATTNRVPVKSAAELKWETLYRLCGALGIAGSSPREIKSEVSETKKARGLPRTLREL